MKYMYDNGQNGAILQAALQCTHIHAYRALHYKPMLYEVYYKIYYFENKYEIALMVF